MKEWEKRIFGRYNTANLVAGMVAIFTAIAVIAFWYGGMLGIGSEQFASNMLTVCPAILIIGIIGGVWIGFYIQTELIKRRYRKIFSPLSKKD